MKSKKSESKKLKDTNNKTESTSDKKALSRNQEIVRAGVIGIVTNVLLASLKAVVGLLSNSIAIILDSLNNLSDALSSVITIIGLKLSLKRANKKHPLGYGRIEYLSAILIAGLVIFAGVSSVFESIKKIIHPVNTNYTLITFIIISIAIIAKLLLGSYTKRVGKKVNSDSLIASGADAFFDSVISFSTLVGAGITVFFGINLDGWIGSIIALVMIKAGLGILMDTLNRILGERIDGEYSKKIKSSISEIDGVLGAYDLIIHNYGPETMIGSVDIEVNDKLGSMWIYRLTLLVKNKIYNEFGIILNVGIYVKNTQPGPELDFENEIKKIIYEENHVIEVHGFYVDLNRKVATMDIVKDFKVEDNDEFVNNILKKIKEAHPDITYNIQLDTDYSD